jgi:hypothetical protein
MSKGAKCADLNIMRTLPGRCRRRPRRSRRWTGLRRSWSRPASSWLPPASRIPRGQACRHRWRPSLSRDAATTHQGVHSHSGGSKARSRPDSERPARAKTVRHPSDDRLADRRSSERGGDPERHHPPAHGPLGRKLHQAVRRVGEGQCGHADDHEGGGVRAWNQAGILARRQRPGESP